MSYIYQDCQHGRSSKHRRGILYDLQPINDPRFNLLATNWTLLKMFFVNIRKGLQFIGSAWTRAVQLYAGTYGRSRNKRFFSLTGLQNIFKAVANKDVSWASKTKVLFPCCANLKTFVANVSEKKNIIFLVSRRQILSPQQKLRKQGNKKTSVSLTLSLNHVSLFAIAIRYEVRSHTPSPLTAVLLQFTQNKVHLNLKYRSLYRPIKKLL